MESELTTNPSSLDASKPKLPEICLSIVSIILDSQPSCLEFAKSQDILIVGTYNLEPTQSTELDVSEDHTGSEAVKPTQRRTGSLLRFKVTEQTVTLLETKLLPYGVLDLHFSPINSSFIAVATSVGSVCIFSLDDRHAGGCLSFSKSIQVSDSSTLVLSLSYQVPDSTKVASPLAISLSNGHLATLTEEQHEQNVSTIPAHSQEAWTVAWAKLSSQAHANETELYSGGDDCVLSKHTGGFPYLNSEGGVTVDEYHPVSRDVRTHGAGVTSIVVSSVQQDGQDVLITGSYDEHIRVLILSKHAHGRATVLAETPLGGGVWRISKPFALNLMDRSFKVLASCMHAGARVLEIQESNGTWSIKVLAMFTEHESMNYASDVRSCNGGFLFVSTSFYDRKLCMWKMNDISV